MKYFLIFLIAITTFKATAQDEENPKLVRHGIYGELWGAGGHGSIGYKLGLNFKPKLLTNCYAGIGANISRIKNPFSALTFPIGISEEFKFLKFMSLEGGLFGTVYLNYISTFTSEEKDCFGYGICPPDNAFYLTAFIGTNFFIKEFSICPRMDMYLPNFWTNKVQFWPSLALRYTF